MLIITINNHGKSGQCKTHKHIIKYKSIETLDSYLQWMQALINFFYKSTMPSEPYHWIMAQPIKHH